MIRWVMRNLRLATGMPDFPCVSRLLVWTLLTNKFQGILSTSQRAKEVVRKGAEGFATLAIIGADPTFTAVFGDTTSLTEALSGSPLLNMSFDDWMGEPLPLRLQDCEAATRQRTGRSSDPAVATPTSLVFTDLFFFFWKAFYNHQPLKTVPRIATLTTKSDTPGGGTRCSLDKTVTTK
jgi:hypothetical protein